MYREAPPMCCVCGRAIAPSEADLVEAGLRCRRCSDAAELNALAPKLAEARRIQREWLDGQHGPWPRR